MVEEQDLYLIKLELYYFVHEKIVNASAVGTFKEFIYLFIYFSCVVFFRLLITFLNVLFSFFFLISNCGHLMMMFIQERYFIRFKFNVYNEFVFCTFVT